MIYQQITDLIGNTPLLRIPADVHQLHNIELYAKLEMMNPFGSVKDRVAWGILKEQLPQIKSQGQTIYENSSGNTAKALQTIANIYGVKTKLITYLAKVEGVKDILRLLGAEIEEILGGSECFDPNDPNDPQYLIEKTVKNDPYKGFFPSQFTNPKNPEIHYATTGKEIEDDLGQVDYFFGGLGTSGSTLGVARRLKNGLSKNLQSIGICASKNDFIPGIRSLDQMWESGLFVRDNYKDFVYVDSTEAVDAMMVLVKKVGILCGPTSGASYLGTLKYLGPISQSLTETKKAVFIVCDRMEWYIDYIRARRPQLFSLPAKPTGLRAFKHTLINSKFEINIDQFSNWQQTNTPLIVDIRSNLAYKLSSIPGSINIPSDALEKIIDGTQPFPKELRLLLVCPVGEKSNYYAAYLQSRGYQTYSLAGGILSWRNAGKQLEKFAA